MNPPLVVIVWFSVAKNSWQSENQLIFSITEYLLVDGSILLRVHNSVGKFVMEKEVNNSVTEWELPDSYPSGIYWISASNQLELFGVMLMIQRE